MKLSKIASVLLISSIVFNLKAPHKVKELGDGSSCSATEFSNFKKEDDQSSSLQHKAIFAAGTQTDQVTTLKEWRKAWVEDQKLVQDCTAKAKNPGTSNLTFVSQ